MKPKMDVLTSRCLATLKSYSHVVWNVSFSSGRKYIASGLWDKNVKIWNVLANRYLAVPQGHGNRVISVSFSGGGRYVASTSWDVEVVIWIHNNITWQVYTILGKLGVSLIAYDAVFEWATIFQLNKKMLEQKGAKFTKKTNICNEKEETQIVHNTNMTELYAQQLEKIC